MSGALAGRLLGKYRLLERIGSGRLADVYRALQIGLEREVAVKVLPPALAADPVMAARFRRESQAAARLSHPNVITIFDSGESGGVPYYVMEQLPQGSLEERLVGGALPLDKVLKITSELVRALACAHEKQVAHGGLEPGCVRFDARGNAVLTDFGAGDGDQAADLAAVGRLMHAMLTGQEPPAEGKPPRVDQLDPELPVDVATLVARLAGAEGAPLANARDALAEVKKLELAHKAFRIARKTARIQLPAVPAVSSPADGPLSVSDSMDPLNLVSSLSLLMSSPEDRREVGRSFLWALLPGCLLALVAVVWVVRVFVLG